jgi:hypothetical protein
MKTVPEYIRAAADLLKKQGKLLKGRSRGQRVLRNELIETACLSQALLLVGAGQDANQVVADYIRMSYADEPKIMHCTYADGSYQADDVIVTYNDGVCGSMKEMQSTLAKAALYAEEIGH